VEKESKRHGGELVAEVLKVTSLYCLQFLTLVFYFQKKTEYTCS